MNDTLKIGVVIADIDEFNPCKNSLGDLVKKEYKIKHMPAFDFEYNNHEVTAVCFGIGKVNAAIGAALALTLGEYDGVINTGWSGAVSGVKKGEIIASDSCVECDFDLTPIGRLPGQKPGQEDYIYKCDNSLYNAACSVEGFKHGNLGCGDFFLTDAERRNRYREIFNISAFDMESGAIGAVCYFAQMPFLSIRKISDNADDPSAADAHACPECDAPELLQHVPTGGSVIFQRFNRKTESGHADTAECQLRYSGIHPGDRLVQPRQSGRKSSGFPFIRIYGLFCAFCKYRNACGIYSEPAGCLSDR